MTKPDIMPYASQILLRQLVAVSLQSHNSINFQAITMFREYLRQSDSGERSMGKTKLLNALTIKGGKCKFSSSCSLFSGKSYTCMHAGGDYCGIYRKLSHHGNVDRQRKGHLVEVTQ